MFKNKLFRQKTTLLKFLTSFTIDPIFVEVFENNGLNKRCCYESGEDKHEAEAQYMDVVNISVHLRNNFTAFH